MEKIQPSEKIRKEINGLLSGGVVEGSVISGLITKASALVLQELLEQEVTDFLGRGHYERSEGSAAAKKGYRNGYEPKRIKTGEGCVKVYRPQVRGSDEPFISKPGMFFRGHTEVLEKLAVEMYARGLSTRDIEDALMEATGDVIVSRTAVSRMTEVLYREFEEFQRRDLSGYEVEYLFLDALYETLRSRYGMKEAVLCAWAITRTGEKVLLHLGLGNKESYRDWLEFIRDMVTRGLRVPTSITSDGAPGLMQAIEVVYPKSLRLRCWFHRMENFRGKVPAEVWPEVKGELILIRDASSYAQGMQRAGAFIECYRDLYPTLVKTFQDDLEALLNQLRIPVRHRKNVRTTNLIERSFEEERRRTKIIPGFLTEKSGLKLVYATLIRAARRWQRVTFTSFDITFLDKLRNDLGLHESEVTMNAIADGA